MQNKENILIGTGEISLLSGILLSDLFIFIEFALYYKLYFTINNLSERKNLMMFQQTPCAN